MSPERLTCLTTECFYVLAQLFKLLNTRNKLIINVVNIGISRDREVIRRHAMRQSNVSHIPVVNHSTDTGLEGLYLRERDIYREGEREREIGRVK